MIYSFLISIPLGQTIKIAGVSTALDDCSIFKKSPDEEEINLIDDLEY